jgi:hypothetical protein
MVSGEASASRSDIAATHIEFAKAVWVACIPEAKSVSYKCYIRNAWVKCVYTLPLKALGQFMVYNRIWSVALQLEKCQHYHLRRQYFAFSGRLIP